MNLDISKPTLVEPGVKYFLKETLANCASYKKTYYNNVFNISIGLALGLFIVAILYYKYKGKPSPAELVLNERKKKHYILSRIKNYQDAKVRKSQENITGLPNWANEYDVIK